MFTVGVLRMGPPKTSVGVDPTNTRGEVNPPPPLPLIPPRALAQLTTKSCFCICDLLQLQCACPSAKQNTKTKICVYKWLTDVPLVPLFRLPHFSTSPTLLHFSDTSLLFRHFSTCPQHFSQLSDSATSSI